MFESGQASHGVFIGPMKVSERWVMSSECDKMHKGKQILESH